MRSFDVLLLDGGMEGWDGLGGYLSTVSWHVMMFLGMLASEHDNYLLTLPTVHLPTLGWELYPVCFGWSSAVGGDYWCRDGERLQGGVLVVRVESV